jgi:predicted nucleotidyltransferase
VLRDDFGPDSDVDMLVEFGPGAPVSLFAMGWMQVKLSAILGQAVAVRTVGHLSRYFRDDVVSNAVTIYHA